LEAPATAGQKVPLDQFIAEAQAKTRERIETGLTQARDVAGYLKSNARREPEIQAQLDRMLACLSPDLAEQDRPTRMAAAHEATTLRKDLKERWIAADNPPLVDEIDARLSELGNGIDALRTADTLELQSIARRIDSLSERADAFGAIEARFLPWARMAVGLFVLGLLLLIFRRTLAEVPVVSNPWISVLCLGAFPAVAIGYAWRALPRSRLDSEIETLNREHFQPLGGIYFAEGTEPPGVIRTAIPGEAEEAPFKDPRRSENRIGPLW